MSETTFMPLAMTGDTIYIDGGITSSAEHLRLNPRPLAAARLWCSTIRTVCSAISPCS
jgi:hypothetical protein